ncbi:hypothetical protein ACP4OV_011404 [Aristida adscensionis]
MKLMKLGTRPDTFFSSGSVRSVYTEVPTDLQILVDHCLFRLHKFPLLSKCVRLQALCAGAGAGDVELPDFPGGAQAFEACARFCYGVTVTVGAHNVVPVRCAAARLGMTEAAGRGNLAAKLDAFLASCLLRRWKDALAVLRATASRCSTACEELGVTSRCVDAVAALIADPSSSSDASASASASVPAGSSSPWWARDVSELGADLFWRVMVAVKAAGTVRGRDVGDALKVYARRWLPIVSKNGRLADGVASSVEPITQNRRLLVEKMVSLLPAERNAVSCGFLLKLLKAATILGASPASKAELTRRVALQLEDANVRDLLIPSTAPAPAPSATGTLYDVDAVVAILEEFALRQVAAAGIPEASPARAGTHRRSRSAESAEFDGARRSTSAPVLHTAMVRVAKVIDGFLIEVARDANLPLDKLIAIAEAVPDCARPEHDDLYRVVDAYLRAHPGMDKSSTKKLCRVINCRKLSATASMHAAQNELLPLRVVVQVLFFENARAAALSGGPGATRVADMAGDVNALRAKPRAKRVQDDERLRGLPVAGAPGDDEWSVEGLKRTASRIKTLRMNLEEEDEEEDDEAFVHRARAGLPRSASWRPRAFCVMPLPSGKPKRVLRRLWPTSRAVADR